MGCNGVYGLFGNGFMNPYLPMAGYLTSTLGHSPCNIWPARNWTQAAQSWTHCAAYPYGFNFNFTGRRTQYIVADPFQMPYQTALGLQTGQVYGGMSADQLKYCFEQRNERFVVDLSVTKTVSNLQQVKSIGACKDFAYMKAEENKELRDEVVALEKKAEELLKQFEEVMKDANSLGTDELAAKVKVYSENAKALVGESDELYKRVKEAEKAYNDKKTEEAAAAAEEAAAGAGSSAGDGVVDGESSVTTTEGDKELKTNEALSSEYGVKQPIIASDQDVSVVVQELKTHTNNDDDAKDYKTVKEMFTTGKINAGNIVEVMEEYGGYEKLYNGIYEMDNSKEIMTLFLSALTQRVKALKDGGFITQAEYNDYNKKINKTKGLLGDDNKDIASKEKFIAMTDNGTTKNIKVFSEYLKTYVIDKIKGKGTQADFDKKIEAKKKERTTKAKADFYKDHATKVGKEVNGTPALPAGVTYLPNSKEFQWKYDSSTVFKASSYKALNDKILASKKTEVIAKWNDILKTMDASLKDKAAS